MVDYVSIENGRLLIEASAFSKEDLRDTKEGLQPLYEFISNPLNLSKTELQNQILNRNAERQKLEPIPTPIIIEPIQTSIAQERPVERQEEKITPIIPMAPETQRKELIQDTFKLPNLNYKKIAGGLILGAILFG